MIIGLDLGTSSLSAVLFDTRKGIVSASEECANDAGIAGASGDSQGQDAEIIADAACRLIGRMARSAPPGKITGLALTGQQHGLLAVDENLNPLTPLVTWRDRQAGASEAIRRHRHAASTGCFLHPGYGGLTLHHLISNGKLPGRTHKVFSITGFLAARLTGRCVEDETMAASWGLLSLRTRQWHGELLEMLGIPMAILPEIAPAGGALGPIVCPKLLKLSSHFGQVTVFSPVGDNQAGFAGACEAGGGEAVVSLGTSSQISVFSRKRRFSPEIETRPFPGGGYLRVYAALCGGWAYAYLAGFFQQAVARIAGIEMPLASVFERMNEFATTTDSAGLAADTRFAGERNGKGAAGAISGINTANLTPANLTRAFAGGIAGELAAAARRAGLLDGITRLMVVGNAASRIPLLVKALESQFGLPCRVVDQGGGTALGAVRLVQRLRHSSRPPPPHRAFLSKPQTQTNQPSQNNDAQQRTPA